MNRKPSLILPTIAVLMLVLYVLSIGPAYAWWDGDERTGELLKAVYSPLYWLREHSEAADNALGEYHYWCFCRFL